MDLLLQDTFQSYGLKENTNAAISYEAADTYGMAIKWLVQGWRSDPRYGSANLFFSSGRGKPEPTDFMECSTPPTTISIARFLRAPDTGQVDDASTVSE